jgi:hypothetical protein
VVLKHISSSAIAGLLVACEACMRDPTTLEPTEYNYDHFRSSHLLADAAKTIAGSGVHAGMQAPDFELPQVGNGPFRLSANLQRPVLLHFGSYT